MAFCSICRKSVFTPCNEHTKLKCANLPRGSSGNGIRLSDDTVYSISASPCSYDSGSYDGGGCSSDGGGGGGCGGD